MAKRALIIGVSDYKPVAADLPSARWAIQAWETLLLESYQFAESDVRLLENERVTKASVVDRLIWLLAHAGAGDQLVFIFCGHGARLARRTRKWSASGSSYEEALVLYPAGASSLDSVSFRDDELAALYRTMSVPSRALPTFIFDCCFSGGLDFSELPTLTGPPAPPEGLPVREATAVNLGIFGLGLTSALPSAPPLVIAATAASNVAREIERDSVSRTLFSSLAIAALTKNPALRYDELATLVASKMRSYGQAPHLMGKLDRIHNRVFE